MNLSEWIQLLIAVFTALAAISAAFSIHQSKKDRELQYKPQFEIITDELENNELNIANLNPNYQSYEVVSVKNQTVNKNLDFEKQLTVLNGGLNFLKIDFKKDNRSHSKENIIKIKYKSVIGIIYEEQVILHVDKNYQITHDIKGLVFR
ncbi:hypothetical protein MUB24_07105 [Lederbergia sp. NSJ-179]|uniref:hypothetical protein n=1 Tax=Lederbergia sp. NSJ-179 TaxID=2931402 RepID=UPI001FD6049C|nr:hypothetical protein [Lederbergia sp. NSJ-179]MCJ7840679.1 hypothetical protein [Lederbergia sp. NSJ-179]